MNDSSTELQQKRRGRTIAINYGIYSPKLPTRCFGSDKAETVGLTVALTEILLHAECVPKCTVAVRQVTLSPSFVKTSAVTVYLPCKNPRLAQASQVIAFDTLSVSGL